MKLIVLLEEIRPLRTVEEGVETLVRRIVQGVADLEHAATDSETGQRIQKLVNELQGLYGAAAHAIVTGTQAAIDEVEVLVDDVEDDVEGDDDTSADDDAGQDVAAPAAPVSAAPAFDAPLPEPDRASELSRAAGITPRPAPLPGTSPAAAQMASSPEPAPAPTPPIGAPGTNGSAPAPASEPSTPAELVDNLNAQHDAAKAADEPSEPAPEAVLEGNDAALAGMGSPAASGAQEEPLA